MEADSHHVSDGAVAPCEAATLGKSLVGVQFKNSTVGMTTRHRKTQKAAMQSSSIVVRVIDLSQLLEWSHQIGASGLWFEASSHQCVPS